MSISKNTIWLCLVIIAFACSSQKQQIVNHQQKVNPFFIYNFGGLQNKTPPQQISLLKKTGYEGICLRMAKPSDVEKLNEFIHIADKTENFKIYAVFVRYDFNASKIDKNRWKEVVDKIQNKNIALWFIFGKPEKNIDDINVEEILRNVVTYAAVKKVPVTLYPHSYCYFYSAEQALPMVKKINHPNLKLAVHTCHELKAGNAGRLAEVVNNVKDYLSFVTIAGAAQKMDTTTKKTMNDTTIKPLEESTYNFSSFFNALKKIEYKGPVGYINFGFKKPPEAYLQKSLNEWKNLKNNYLKY